MIKQALLATVLVASFSSFASAQDAPPPPPPGAPQADAVRPGEDHRDRWKEHAEDRRDRRGPGGHDGERRGPGQDGPKQDRRGPGSDKSLDKGIELKMGRGGASVRIECGDEPMAECLAAAGPMLEKLDRKGGHHGYGRHRGERPPMGDEGLERQDD